MLGSVAAVATMYRACAGGMGGGGAVEVLSPTQLIACVRLCDSSGNIPWIFFTKSVNNCHTLNVHKHVYVHGRWPQSEGNGDVIFRSLISSSFIHDTV